MSPSVRAHRQPDGLRGQVITVRASASATPTARTSTARSSATRTRRRRRRRRRARLARAPAARGDRRSRHRSSCPPGKLDVEGETPLETASASSPRRSARRPSDWEASNLLRVQRLHRRGRPRLPGRPGLRDATRRDPTRTSASRSSRWPLSDLDGAIDDEPGRKDAHRPARAARACATRAPNGALHGKQAREPRRGEPGRWPSPGHRHTRSSTTCSTSSPTSSSSAGCRATRSRPTAPTCCSSAHFLVRRARRVGARRTPSSPLSSELAAGTASARPSRPRRCSARPRACAPSTATCAARRSSTHDPTGGPARAAQEPEAAAGAHPRRGRQAARAPRGHDPAALRDRALLELMYACGLRATEAIDLEVGRRRPRAGVLRARGKGSKERAVPDRPRGVTRRSRPTCERGRPRSSARARSATCSSTTAAAG